MEIIEKIIENKNGTTILAHSYQSPDILSVADVKGDSYMLAKAAAKLDSKRVLVCGVRFMAEVVKILSPEKEVVLANPAAGCPMADCVDFEKLQAVKKEFSNIPIVSYINTTVQTKAISDVCVTSSSAVKIIKAMPEKELIFLPDRNLGSWIQKRIPEKKIILWDGCCPVHNSVLGSEAKREKRRHKDAFLAVHPECNSDVTSVADVVGATSTILDLIMDLDVPVIIGTEIGVYDFIKANYPEKKVYQLCPDKLVCKDMKLTTIENVYDAVTGKGGEVIEIDEETRLLAKKSLDAMLKYGN